MSQLPVIVGFGGISPAGRSSFHHGYRRLILDQLDSQSRIETLTALATLMQRARFTDGQYTTRDGRVMDSTSLAQALDAELRADTLIRRIHPDWFDVSAVMLNKPATLQAEQGPVTFRLRNRHLPQNPPANWQITPLTGGESEIQVLGGCDVIFPDYREAAVQSAGMLPTGFDPGSLYQSRNHPRGLQMSVYAASDAIRSVGIDFKQLAAQLSPDQIAVFASNSIGQLDDNGFGGLTKFPALGKRTTSKQMPLGYAQMPADFINAYLLGNVGLTGGALGACATFLYNLRSGVEEIRSGRRKLVMVGGSDAPVTPEIIEGFRAMGALAEDKYLMALDNLSSLQDDDYRRACRPFGNNCGFTIGESSQYLVLMSDDLAIETGAQILGAVGDVFVHADGHKKSISAPGIGNYMTLGKAASLVRSLLGETALRQRSYVQAHGTSTPQNRVTESHVINETAKAFGIDRWTVSAVKAYIGHSQGCAGGDQIMSSLGAWQYGVIPGLITTPEIADDVHQSHLNLPLEHLVGAAEQMDSVLINAKGFGGNNASAVLLSPTATEALLGKRYGQSGMQQWRQRNEQVQATARDYDQEATQGLSHPDYLYDHQVLTGEDLSIDDKAIHLPGYVNPVSIDVSNPYQDFNE